MSDQFEQNLLNNLMDNWILPSVRERQEKGELEKPLPFTMAQILFKPEGDKPEVRVNGEVRGKAIVSFKVNEGRELSPGDGVLVNDIEEIKAFELEDDEKDLGHAIVLKTSDNWFITFNFIYNRNNSQKHLQAAEEFLFAAEKCIEQKHLRAAVDSLHSASELAAKAFLLGKPGKTILSAKSHGVVGSRINLEKKLGNVNENHVSSFNRLKQLRSSARYLNSEFVCEKSDVEKLYHDIKEFTRQIGERCQSKV